MSKNASLCIAGMSALNRDPGAHVADIQAGMCDLWALHWDELLPKYYGPPTTGATPSQFEATRYFEIHPSANWGYMIEHDPQFLTRLGAIQAPVMFADEFDKRSPADLVYPMEEVVNTDIMPGVVYLESSIAYMLALAYLERRSTIYLDGVDMALGSEYEYQRSNLAYLVGFIQAKGVQVIAPAGSGVAEFTERGGKVPPNIWRPDISRADAEYGLGVMAANVGVERMLYWVADALDGLGLPFFDYPSGLLASAFTDPAYYGPHSLIN
jgi:hypothetical protein